MTGECSTLRCHRVGESVLAPVVSSRSPRLTNRLLNNERNMRSTFAPFVLVFVDFNRLEWNRFVSLNQQLFQFVSRYWIHSVKQFPLGPFNLAGFRQTWLRELIRSLKIDVFGSLAFLLWSIFVTHTAVRKKSDQRVCLVPVTILLSFDKLNSGFSSATAVPVIGNRGTLICP